MPRRALRIVAGVVVIIVMARIVKRNALMRYAQENMPISMLEGRVRDNPGDVSSAEVMTKRLMAEGKASEAFKVLREATSKGDAPGDIWLMRARAAHAAHDDIDAARSAQKAL